MLGLTPIKTVINETIEIRVNTRYQEVRNALVSNGIEARWNYNVVTIYYNNYDNFMQVIRGLR